MVIVDANVLLHAVNERAREHEVARGWLEDALSGDEEVGLPDVVLLAFLRLATRHGVFARPLAVAEACALAREWLAVPSAAPVVAAPDHYTRLCGLIEATGSGGNLVTDAHLAALALERDATVVTFDRDFERFASLRVNLLSADESTAGPRRHRRR